MKEKATQKRRAIALEYNPDQDLAPRVTAVGENILAEQIISLARSQQIPIHEDPFLADALAQVEVSETIPPELYALVAEILAYVYRINQKIAGQK